jgi:AcrR family transcriptional regulator
MNAKPRQSLANHSASCRKPALGARVSRSVEVSRARRKPAQHRSRVTVYAIVEAAGQLLVEGGRAAVTTNAVAARAGVSIGSLYQYFPNKEALFAALQQQHREEVGPLIHHALSRLSDPSIDLVAGIVMLMRGMVELHKADPARLRALAEELGEPTTPAEIQELAEATTRALCQRSGKSEQQVRSQAWLAAQTLTHVGRALVHHPPELMLDDVFDSLSRMLGGLLAGVDSGPLTDR